MKIYTDLSTFQGAKSPVLTTGTFDGVHIGHKKILQRLNDIAAESEGESVLFTFHPHPRLVLFPDHTDLKLLNTQAEKIALLETSGIDHLIIFPFTREFSRMTSVEFIRDILVNQIHIRHLVIGYDHHFGRNREGSIENLRELGPLYDFSVEEIPAETVNEINVSSTKIRHALAEGDMKTVFHFLGYHYPLSGIVISGKKIGRDIGFPTANIKVTDPNKLIPGDGVYAVKVKVLNQEYSGMLNIGMKPTVNENQSPERSLEVHVFDFDEEIYNKTIQLEFIDKIREEQKFADLEALKAQLLRDKETVTGIFQSI